MAVWVGRFYPLYAANGVWRVLIGSAGRALSVIQFDHVGVTSSDDGVGAKLGPAAVVL